MAYVKAGAFTDWAVLYCIVFVSKMMVKPFSKEALADEACCMSGARIGRYRLRCCAVGEWFVYEGDRMLFDTLLVGFESFEQAFEALYSHLLSRVRWPASAS